MIYYYHKLDILDIPNSMIFVDKIEDEFKIVEYL